MINIVFSYDCEGNWGLVDRAEPALDSRLAGTLQEAYRFLLDLHLSHDIPASFAFVGLYALTPDKRADYLSSHADALHNRAKYLARSGGCWEGAANFETIHGGAQKSDLIDIGSHSLTHLPFDQLDADDQRDELLASKQILARLVGSDPKTFIYPRNIFGSLSECGRHYRSFRNTPAPTRIDWIINSARTATGLFPLLESQYSDQIFWRGGAWKRVPDYGWKRMWRKRMRVARARSDSVQTVHVWTHPHNLVTDPGQKDRIRWLFDLLEANRPHIKFLKLSEISPEGQELPAVS